VQRRFERSRIEAELLAAVYDALLTAPALDPPRRADSQDTAPVARARTLATAGTTAEAPEPSSPRGLSHVQRSCPRGRLRPGLHGPASQDAHHRQPDRGHQGTRRSGWSDPGSGAVLLRRRLLRGDPPAAGPGTTARPRRSGGG